MAVTQPRTSEEYVNLILGLKMADRADRKASNAPYREKVGGAPERVALPNQPLRFMAPAHHVLAATVIFAPAGLVLLWQALNLGSVVAVVLGVGIAGFVGSLPWRIARMRAVLHEDYFEAQTAFGRASSGHPHEFLCFRANPVHDCYDLVRCDDLFVVRVPAFKSQPEARHAIEGWLTRRIPPGGTSSLRHIEKGSQLPEQRTLSELAKAPAKGHDAWNQRLDLELACAARAAWRFRYRSALPALHELVLRLPSGWLARQYAIEALRRMGDHESFDTLRKAMQLPDCERELVARALADLATAKDYDVADALSKHGSGYVSDQGNRALRRLGGPPAMPT